MTTPNYPMHPVRRSAAIFRLALSYWRDSRTIRRLERSALPAVEKDQRIQALFKAGGIRLRETALALGGLIIKVGQFLSARSDILPAAFVHELQSLQDEVPPAPFEAIQSLLRQEWQTDWATVLLDLQPEPMAAASLGQVHFARLRATGQAVAVKVQRPDIPVLAAIDLRALRIIMGVMERTTTVGRRLRVTALLDEFEKLVGEELDYVQEAAHLTRFRDNFRDHPTVRVPDVITEWTRARVLVMTYVPGIKLTNRAQLLDVGLDPTRLATHIIDAYLQQILVDGLVHIDPHPGNLLTDQEGHLIFLDFGMMARIGPSERQAVSDLLRAITQNRPEDVAYALQMLGFLEPWANMTQLTRALRLFMGELMGTPLAPGPQRDQAVQALQTFLYEEPLRFPALYLFLGRALGMLFGLVETLDPDREWSRVLTEQVLPWVQRARRGQRAGWTRWLDQLAERLDEPVASAVLLAGGWLSDQVGRWSQWPGRLERVLRQIEDGRMTTQPEITPVLSRLDTLSEWARSAFRALVAIWLVLAAWFYEASHLVVWAKGLVIGLSGMVLLISGRRRRRWGRPRRERL
ncbi:ABC-1 domain-containing protein [Sulfobacillus acidophilus DSM 10332]|uniref:ABC-1 domain-containing protein n=1 Tax=Sulfobacillus acidophilus (strain ATCC 700253 / DSM 10332 / NAL) TaxID=679936 RepID=G8U1A6_SULAD|nr:ABC-1 domain-containing protein [Sulfobacillus acidophilus DSM 10332]